MLFSNWRRNWQTAVLVQPNRTLRSLEQTARSRAVGSKSHRKQRISASDRTNQMASDRRLQPKSCEKLGLATRVGAGSKAVVRHPERVHLLVALANGDSNAYGQSAVEDGTAEKEHYPSRQWHCVFSLCVIRSCGAFPEDVSQDRPEKDRSPSADNRRPPGVFSISLADLLH